MFKKVFTSRAAKEAWEKRMHNDANELFKPKPRVAVQPANRRIESATKHLPPGSGMVGGSTSGRRGGD